MSQNTDLLMPVLRAAPVVPVIKIDDLDAAVPLARALVAGGLTAIEITLRTPIALEAIKAVANEVEGANVGAGTILNAKQFEAAEKAGATFIVSPGTTQELLDVANSSKTPLLPGTTTPSEVMAAMEEGYEVLKFFPAEQSGGASFMKSLSSVLAGVSFCPTGGISTKNAKDYLSLPNVVCVGGSWVAPTKAIKEGAWDEITALAKAAMNVAA